jgi:glycine oxidase
MRTHSDVVIVGGGAIGSSIAYRLASVGLSVTVIERDSVGSHASGYALGLLNPTNETGSIESLNHQSFIMHQEMLEVVEQESGVDVQVLTMPHIELALEESEIVTLKKECDRIAAFSNFTTNWLEPDEITRFDSRITREIYGGLLVEDVIAIDSYNFTLATAQAAESRGAEYVLREATGLVYDRDRVAGVMVGEDCINCGTVVLALGPWSAAASLWAGIDIPIVPQKGEILRLEELNPRLDFHVHGFTLGSSCSILQKADGAVWLAATVQDDTGFDVTPSLAARESLVLRGTRMMPELEWQQMLLQTACMRPVTPDGDPILGKIPDKEGVFIASGTGGKGILLAPVIGRAMADLISAGKTEIDIVDFGLERFSAS